MSLVVGTESDVEVQFVKPEVEFQLVIVHANA